MSKNIKKSFLPIYFRINLFQGDKDDSISLSSFNRYFGNNPLQTLTKIRDESIENGNPELTKNKEKN